MKIKQGMLLWLLLLLPVWAEAQESITPKGLRYKILERKAGTETAQIGDYISLRLYTFNYKDSLLNKQDVQDVPVEAGTSPIDVRDVIPFLAVGDSVLCLVKTDTFARYAGRHLPPFLPTGTDMKHYMRITKVEKTQSFREAETKTIDDYAKANGLKTIKLPSGLQYVVTQQGTGAKPQQGEQIKVHYKGTLLDGKQFDSSYDRGQPFAFTLGVGGVIRGWDEGLALLNMGSKATLLVPSHLAYGKRGAGEAIPANAILRFDVELIETPSEKKVIEDYAKANKLQTLTTASGLQYAITFQGKGALPAKGQTVVVHYRGSLLNGQEFDSSYSRNQPFEFTLGVGQVIKGWDEGIALMKVGTRATLLIPSALGYGSRGAGANIPPDSVLRFDVELINVK
jgi:peptidylprolyl isomerase